MGSGITTFGETVMTMRSQISRSRTARLLRPLRNTAVLCATVVLAGCSGTNRPASVSGGECRVFERPEIAVRGARRYDQDWIDGNVEAGVGACGWQRPKPRPAGMDGHASRKPAPIKRTLVQRVKAAVRAEPIEPVPYFAPLPTPSPRRDVGPPAPVDPLDDLLGTGR